MFNCLGRECWISHKITPTIASFSAFSSPHLLLLLLSIRQGGDIEGLSFPFQSSVSPSCGSCPHRSQFMRKHTVYSHLSSLWPKGTFEFLFKFAGVGVLLVWGRAFCKTREGGQEDERRRRRTGQEDAKELASGGEVTRLWGQTEAWIIYQHFWWTD